MKNVNPTGVKYSILQQIREVLKGFDIKAAIIFGRFVTHDKYRDIDLMVVLKRSEDLLEIKEALLEIDKLDPSFIMQEELEKRLTLGDPFYLNVIEGEVIIGREHLERWKELASKPKEEIIERYHDLLTHALKKAERSGEYFDAYVACKFFVEYLLMKHLGRYVKDPHAYNLYLGELLPIIDMCEEDARVLERVLMYRRGDRELIPEDEKKAVEIIGKIISIYRI
ncbi:MAG: hypothetical protein ACXQT5_02475 [Candidatus Syntropharchaeia archaeon]